MSSRKPLSKPSHPPVINTNIRRPRRSDTAFSALSNIEEPPFSNEAAHTYAPSSAHANVSSTSESRVEVQVTRDIEVTETKSKTVVPGASRRKDHRGWVKLAKKLGKHDKETIKGCNADIDTLLVFVSRSISLLNPLTFVKLFRLVYFLPSSRRSSSKPTSLYNRIPV